MSTTTPGPTSARRCADAAGPTPSEQVLGAVPAVGGAARFRSVARHQITDLAQAALAALPGLRPLLDQPRTQPLKSSSVRMARWWQSPYGTTAKPASLQDIPWDYVESNQDTIPFLGLREY